MTPDIARAQPEPPCEHSPRVECARCWAKPEPMADWISQAELEDIERQARIDGLLIGVALGFAVGVPVAYLVLRWVS